MCGRYRLTTKAEELAARYHARMPDDLHVAPSWNVAPGQDALALRSNPETGERSLDALRWGLVPHFAKDPKIAHRLVNARAETVDKTPAYRQALAKRRCLIPADGFYEWQKVNGRKVPFHIQMEDGLPFTFAGLWEGWRDPTTGEWLRTCVIITCPASESLQRVHDRMPVILGPERHAAWLGEGPSHSLKAFLVPYPAERMTLWEVSPQVNSPKRDGPSLIDRHFGAESAPKRH